MLKNDATVQNFTRSTAEKFAHISIHAGQIRRLRERTCTPGDIGAVAKLKETLTGDTLGDKASPIQYPQVTLRRAGHHLRHRAQDARR